MLPDLHERGIGRFVIKDPVRVFLPEQLVVLDEVDHINLEAAERFVELPSKCLLSASTYCTSTNWERGNEHTEHGLMPRSEVA